MPSELCPDQKLETSVLLLWSKGFQMLVLRYAWNSNPFFVLLRHAELLLLRCHDQLLENGANMDTMLLSRRLLKICMSDFVRSQSQFWKQYTLSLRLWRRDRKRDERSQFTSNRDTWNLWLRLPRQKRVGHHCEALRPKRKRWSLLALWWPPSPSRWAT